MVGPDQLRKYAYAALEGVGDPTLGEWIEYTGYAYHLRRRLTTDEQTAVGEVKDIRGTPEALLRADKVRKYVLRSPQGQAVWREEVGSRLV